MTPLDLSARPPRPCRTEIDGIVFLARNIDKARAALPGGNLGAFFLGRDDIPTLSGLFFRRFGCTQEAFIDAVASAADDLSVAAWLRGSMEPEAVDRWNARLLGLHMSDLDERVRERLAALYPGIPWNEDDLLIDVIDADDRRSFPGA